MRDAAVDSAAKRREPEPEAEIGHPHLSAWVEVSDLVRVVKAIKLEEVVVLKCLLQEVS